MTATRGWGALSGALWVGSVLVVAGCGGDSNHRHHTATPTPITATATALGGINSPTVAPSATATAAPTNTVMATFCPFTPTTGASATASRTPTATYTELVCPANTATPTPVIACTTTASPTPTGTRPMTPTPGLATLSLFDANPRYTSSVFLPLTEYTAESVAVLTTSAWMDNARERVGAAADGATLLLLAVQLDDASNDAPVQLLIDSSGLPSGGLYPVDDQRLVDRSADGDHIEELSDGPTELLVDTVLIGGERWAFALYRAPRNYDGATPLDTRERPITVSAYQSDALLIARHIDVVRPLLIFLHGTAGDTSNWDEFPLWRDSSNEVVGFVRGTTPFFAERISFQWIALASGHLIDNAATILPQIGRAVETWRDAIHIAATQADIVTHSFGGIIVRQVAQTQADLDPLTPADQSNYRAVTNWGHGSVHKLITLAASHRGSSLANSLAYLNELRDGALRGDLCLDGVDIAAGALVDQMVLSPAVRDLEDTHLPGHAVIGSGVMPFADPPSIAGCASGGCEVCYAASGYHGEYSLYRLQDMPNGPYQEAGDLGGSICGFSFFCEDFNYPSFERLNNYLFNLTYSPPFPYQDCELQNQLPNNDLTVSACSSQGKQPRGAYSTVADFAPELVGHLAHTEMVKSPAVSDRVQFLLQQPTTSTYFAPFAATGDPTCLEEQLMSVGTVLGLDRGQPCSAGPGDSLANTCYKSCNSCEATSTTPPCFAEYRVLPDPLVLHQIGQAAPVFVYGRVAHGPLDGQWTNVQSLANGIWCSVAMSSDTPAVAGITTWAALSHFPDKSGINVVDAVGDGVAALTLTVQNDLDGPLGVTVRVDTAPPAVPGD